MSNTSFRLSMKYTAVPISLAKIDKALAFPCFDILRLCFLLICSFPLRKRTAASEKAHSQRGNRTSAGIFRNRAWRHAVGGGWFSYHMAVEGDSPASLLITYWGSDVGNRKFTVLVDGHPIAEQTLNRNQPNEFFDVQHAISPDLTHGKERITVRFNAHPNSTAGGIFDLRTVRGE